MGADPSRAKVHMGEHVPRCGDVADVARQIAGEVKLSGPSQKWGSCPVGSEAGAGSQLPAPPLAGGTMQTGVGRGFTIMEFAVYVRLLLHTLIPGPPAALQSALVVQARPDVPSKPDPEPCVPESVPPPWVPEPSREVPPASIEAHPMQGP
jgi:hypothetical protein